MTNTLHRFGKPDDLKDDYIIFTVTSRGVNDVGAVEKSQEFLRAALKYKPVNLSGESSPMFRPEKNLNLFKLYIRGRREQVSPDQLIKEMQPPGRAMVVFDNKQALEEFLKEVKKMDLGLSVNVSSLIDDVREMALRTDIAPHSVNYSLGFRGNLYRLPDQQVLALTTMCGHGLISGNFAKKLLDLVKEKRVTPEKAARYMAKFCVCGCFNTSQLHVFCELPGCLSKISLIIWGNLKFYIISWKGKMNDTVIANSICGMCDLYHPTRVHIRQGKAIRVEMLDRRVLKTCPRWTAQLDFVYHPDRLKYPLKRTGERGSDSFKRISWDEALDTVAGELQKTKANYGAESVVFYISLPKEPRPYLQRLAHAFGSPNYCTESSSCYTATALAAMVTYGRGHSDFVGQGLTVDPETRCALVWGSALKQAAPFLWNDFTEAKQKGLKIIAIDPRRTDLATMADIHLQLRPGTDGALALGLMNVIIDEQLYDKEFIENWTIGFDDLKKLASEYSPEKVEAITRVPASKVREAAVLYATQKPAKITVSAATIVHNTNGVQNHRAIILLAALTGNLDVPGGNRGNPGTVPTNNVTLYERTSAMPPGMGADKFPIWTGMTREMQANVLTDRIESGKPYPIKALFGAGLNLTFFANTERLVKNLKKLDFMVVTDYFLTPGARLADIVLPIASWLERPILVKGGFAQPPGYLRLVEPVIEPVGESRHEWKIYSELAKRLGFGSEFWNGDFEKYLNHVLEPSKITVQDLKQHPEGIRYNIAPRPVKKYEQGGFQTPSGKVEIASSILAQRNYEPLPVYREPSESPLTRHDLVKSFPLILTSGARLVQFTHSQYHNIPRLRKAVPEPLIEINPADAKPRGIKSGDMVIVSSPRGSIKLKAVVTDAILPGVVHAMHHWQGDGNVNILVDDQKFDPISGFVPLKSQLCEVRLSD